VIEDLVIDGLGREVSFRGRRIQLTFREFELLRFLAHHRGCTFTRSELVSHVWGAREDISSRTVDIHVHRLRTKLGAPFYHLIETIRHVGYKLSSERVINAASIHMPRARPS
jgi:DNA-binding response OmpR family regulator